MQYLRHKWNEVVFFSWMQTLYNFYSSLMWIYGGLLFQEELLFVPWASIYSPSFWSLLELAFPLYNNTLYYLKGCGTKIKRRIADYIVGITAGGFSVGALEVSIVLLKHCDSATSTLSKMNKSRKVFTVHFVVWFQPPVPCLKWTKVEKYLLFIL